MAFLDVAYSVLAEKRQWTHARDLVQEVLDRNLYTSSAQDPIASLVGTLYSEIRRRPNQRGFVRHGPMIGLKEWGPEIPPPEAAGTRSSVVPSLPLTQEQIIAIKKTMPPDQFESLFGDIWQQYQSQQRQRLITRVNIQQLTRLVRREVDCIQDFLLERTKQAPKPEVIANWIVFCYELELYREGASLFKCIGSDQIGEALYSYLGKIARACELHLKD